MAKRFIFFYRIWDFVDEQQESETAGSDFVWNSDPLRLENDGTDVLFSEESSEYPEKANHTVQLLNNGGQSSCGFVVVSPLRDNVDETGDALLALAETIYAKSTPLNLRQIQDSPYTQRLTHVSSCMTKTLDLAAYREFDRNIVKVTDEDEDDRIPAMKEFIKENGCFPTRDGSIKLGVDKINQTATILDGNHRLTCAANMPVGSYPEYVKFVCQFSYYPDAKKLPSCPDHENWPTFVCGCDLGFSTSTT